MYHICEVSDKGAEHGTERFPAQVTETGEEEDKKGEIMWVMLTCAVGWGCIVKQMGPMPTCDTWGWRIWWLTLPHFPTLSQYLILAPSIPIWLPVCAISGASLPPPIFILYILCIFSFNIFSYRYLKCIFFQLFIQWYKKLN